MTYTIQNVQGFDAAFRADIMLDGKKVMTVRNDGRGGCHRYDFENRAVLDAFTAMAQKWGEENGATSMVEIHDRWVTYHMDGVQLGLTAKQFLNFSLSDLLAIS
jgi:hypothetical protein